MQTTESDTPVLSGLRALPVWIAVGTLGAIGMVVTGSAIGSVPHPAGDNWWFTVPTGTGIVAHLGFYACVGLLLAGWASAIAITVLDIFGLPGAFHDAAQVFASR